MKLLDILQGKWLGHPLHPALVHVPLGLWIIACLCDVVAWFMPDPVVLPRLSFYAVLVGLLGALLAVPPGVADWASIKQEKPAWKLGLYHLLLNVLATLVWAVNFGLRFSPLDTNRPITLAILLSSIVATAFVVVGGYLGSLLAFEHGISVARQSKADWRKIAIAGGARVPEEK